MTVATFGIGIRRDRSLRLGAAVGGLATTAAILLAVLLSPSGSSPSTAGRDVARRAALVSWEATVQPLVLSGGQVVALGPRAGVAQIEQHAFATPVLQQMASGWVRSLSRLQGQIAAVPTPDFVRPAHALLDQAMAGYLTASRDLLAATTASGPARTRLLNAAAAAGKAADHTYDQATAAIAHLRTQLTLPTDWSG